MSVFIAWLETLGGGQVDQFRVYNRAAGGQTGHTAGAGQHSQPAGNKGIQPDVQNSRDPALDEGRRRLLILWERASWLDLPGPVPHGQSVAGFSLANSKPG